MVMVNKPYNCIILLILHSYTIVVSSGLVKIQYFEPSLQKHMAIWPFGHLSPVPIFL
jgi:hypothetical protein